MTRPNDDFLDDLLAHARKSESAPDDDLVARVLADAEAVQAGFPGSPAAGSPPGLLARILDTLGGWPAVSGLAAATVAGVWIGVAPPASVEEITAGLMGEAVSVPLVPSDLGFSIGGLADG